jgi:hypothetical protein
VVVKGKKETRLERKVEIEEAEKMEWVEDVTEANEEAMAVEVKTVVEETETVEEKVMAEAEAVQATDIYRMIVPAVDRNLHNHYHTDKNRIVNQDHHHHNIHPMYSLDGLDTIPNILF